MKKLYVMFLLLCFSFVVTANVGTSPPIEKIQIETVIEQNVDLMVVTHQVINPIMFVEVEISYGLINLATTNILKSQSVNSYYDIDITLTRSEAIRLDLKKSGTARYLNILNNDYIKLTENTIANNCREVEHRIRGVDSVNFGTLYL